MQNRIESLYDEIAEVSASLEMVQMQIQGITNVLLDMEAISNSRLFGWENEIMHSIKNNQELSAFSNRFIKNPSYGDGGMASAVRIASMDK